MGISALAWYEGMRATKVEIVTLDVGGEILNITRKFFKETQVDDRITTIEGPAASTSVQVLIRTLGYPTDKLCRLEQVESQFDLVFLDADKQNNVLYLDIILKRRLLFPKGIVLLDNST